MTLMRIAAEPDRRRYEPTGMTTERWKTVPAEPVCVDDLILQQDALDIAALLGRTASLHDQYPHVVVWQGQQYLDDGHHRVVRAAIKGRDFIYARVLRMEDDDS